MEAKKTNHIRRLVVMMFVAVVLMDLVGLKIVQDHASKEASRKASAVAVKTADTQKTQDRQNSEAQRYQLNFTTCGLRAFIDPNLRTARKALPRALAASKDMSLPPTSRARQAKTVLDIKTQIKTLLKVRALFGTVPPGFDCKTLPKTPPKFIG